MPDSSIIIKELSHLLRYHGQAVYEFFDELQNELAERNGLLKKSLEKGKDVPVEELRKILDMLVSSQEALKKRVDDLGFLTDRMRQVLEGKDSGAEPASSN